MDMSSLQELITRRSMSVIEWISSPAFYYELGLLTAALLLAYLLSSSIKSNVGLLRQDPVSGKALELRKKIYDASNLLFPLLLIIFSGIALEVSEYLFHESTLIHIAQGVAILWMLYSLITKYIQQPVMRFVFRWGLLPISALYVFGVLGTTVAILNNVYIDIGNVRIGLVAVIRVLVFGSILFWLGKVSNSVGKQVIRGREDIEVGTREVFAKLFEVAMYTLVFVLILNIMGINLTALAVFGGALGVGIGFGLQAIASNFISGVIILLDRSISVGDYIELEDGRTGTIRELNMRSTLLETWDGKDVMVPNEQFITSSFVNWTHKDPKQRYSLNFSVAYSTDVRAMVDIVKEVVRSHPQVIAEPDTPFEELPDCEICGFGESGVDILVEWWMEGIDDGKNRVGGDLLLMIFEAFKEHGIQIPFPQREVRLLNS